MELADSEEVLPEQLASLAERKCWFSLSSSEAILDWLEKSRHQLLGVDSAKKLPGGDWVLLLDPILDFSDDTDQVSVFTRARDMIRNNPSLMFDLVWTPHRK